MYNRTSQPRRNYATVKAILHACRLLKIDSSKRQVTIEAVSLLESVFFFSTDPASQDRLWLPFRLSHSYSRCSSCSPPFPVHPLHNNIWNGSLSHDYSAPSKYRHGNMLRFPSVHAYNYSVYYMYHYHQEHIPASIFHSKHILSALVLPITVTLTVCSLHIHWRFSCSGWPVLQYSLNNN